MKRSTATSTRSASAARSSASSACKPVVAGDTAGAAARGRASAATRAAAALAPRLAAEIYGLRRPGAERRGRAHNTTRFVVMSRDGRWTPAGDGPMVTTFVFRVRNVPAALYKALGGFATNGVNMTKLESYMEGGEFTATQFSPTSTATRRSAPLARALEELKFFSREVRIWASILRIPTAASCSAGRLAEELSSLGCFSMGSAGEETVRAAAIADNKFLQKSRKSVTLISMNNSAFPPSEPLPPASCAADAEARA